MTYLLLMLTVGAAMAWFREPLGRGLTHAVRTIDWTWAVILALLILGVWLIVHNPHANMGVTITGDSVAALFDTFAYGDLLVGVTVAIVNRQTRQLIGRAADLARLAGHLVMRLVGRARTVRTPPKSRRRAPDPNEPEPEAWGGIFALA